MAVTPDPFDVDFGTLTQEVDGSLHVENVLPSQALSGDQVIQEKKSLEVASLEFCVLPFSEAGGVRTENDIAFFGKCDSSVMHRTAGQARRLHFSQMPGA